ncbi:MAG: hypothetical protein MnENMB40S_04590 [Rhizobiaceae bacterium MnEN-MB40S]|nr:MAG: hypothetical protein MnENMB40S_04590 [Rhizobiaceae bacterium MnEN-MB40S]
MTHDSKMTHDRVIGGLIVIFGLATGLMTIGWPAGYNSDSVILTTYFFPRMIAIGMVLCGAWIALRPEKRAMDLPFSSILKLAALAVFLLAVVHIARRDFFIAGLVFGTVSLWISRVGAIRSILYAFLISAVVFCVFRYAFSLQIPNEFVRLALNI